MSQTTTVEGVTCEYCEQTAEDALEGVARVTGATADRDIEQATMGATRPTPFTPATTRRRRRP